MAALSGVCVWFTGLPCAGKTTLATHLAEHLRARGERVAIFDGDQVRSSLSADLGFSREHRHANVLRVAAAARDVIADGAIAICALVSPYAQSREEARRLVGAERFIEVYVSTQVEICEARDVKGLYRLARSGKLEHFTGVNDPYEPPERPDVAVVGIGDPDEVILKIVEELDRCRA
ncbi:MAG: adenylyl-sulfate kinase [Acidobacteriia bacterium]|nr:adenylyl-sulfate kinase [Terriglobia bacterium]